MKKAKVYFFTKRCTDKFFLLFFNFLVVIGIFPFSQHVYADNMYANEKLYSGQRLAASGCYYHLDMQSDGNLVVYAGRSPIWASNTVGRGAYSVMQADGNLVVYNWGNYPVWSSGSYGNWWSRLAMQNDGNLVVYRPNNSAAWASGTNGGSIGQSPCYTRTTTTRVERNYDRPGGDYVFYRINRNWPEACEYWCSQDSRCKAFTHVPVGVQEATNARCYLKNTVPPLRYWPGLVSGTIRGR